MKVICNWCRHIYPPSEELLSCEDYGWLCHGCWYCVEHGAPRRMDEDKPFTEEQQRLEAFTTNFFTQVNKLYPKEAL